MDKLLTIKEAASLLNVSEMSLRRWTNAGKLKCYRVGGNNERRFKKEDLMNFLNPGERNMTRLGIGEHLVDASAHIAHFYRTVDESLSAGTAYLRTGLLRGEKILVVSTKNRLPQLLNGLEESGFPISKLLDDRDIIVDSGRNDPSEQIQFMTNIVLNANCPNGFRLLGDMIWALEKNWSLSNLATLEHYTNNALASQNNIFLCQYDLERFSASTALMAFDTHSLTAYRGDLKESPYFVA